jgi:hypothetical protein
MHSLGISVASLERGDGFWTAEILEGAEFQINGEAEINLVAALTKGPAATADADRFNGGFTCGKE